MSTLLVIKGNYGAAAPRFCNFHHSLGRVRHGFMVVGIFSGSLHVLSGTTILAVESALEFLLSLKVPSSLVNSSSHY